MKFDWFTDSIATINGNWKHAGRPSYETLSFSFSFQQRAMSPKNFLLVQRLAAVHCGTQKLIWERIMGWSIILTLLILFLLYFCVCMYLICVCVCGCLYVLLFISYDLLHRPCIIFQFWCVCAPSFISAVRDLVLVKI